MEEPHELNIFSYKQSIKGGCGPSCLLMCLHYFKKIPFLSQLEKEIWADSTFGIINSTCNLGLAIAGFKRGLKVEVFQEFQIPKCFDNNLLDEKSAKLRNKFLEFEKKIKEMNIPINYGPFGFDLLKENIDLGKPIILLIKEENSYHFILVIGYTNEGIIYIDPSSGEKRKCNYNELQNKFSLPDGRTAIVVQDGI